MKEKLAVICKKIFGAGQMGLMLVTLGIICSYIVAFIIGGETAVAIEAFVYAKMFPALYFVVVILAFVGVISLYLTGYRTMRFETRMDDK